MHFTMFQGHTFLRDLLSERSVVLDLGANQGAFAREIHQETGCRVIAVEANAALARSIKREPWLIVHHVLVCGDQGTRVLNLCNNTQASSTVRLEGFQYEGSIEVNATSLSALLRSPDCQGVNIVKCDIEGAEIEAFASCPDDLLVRLSQISIEFHHTMGGGTRDEAASLIRRLQRLGFWRLILTTERTWMCCLYVVTRLGRGPVCCSL
jgi:FkbM family methyltransferase